MSSQSITFPDAGRFSQQPALFTPALTLDYKELVQRACAIAEKLTKMGLAPNDRLAVLAEAGPEYPLLLLGAWSAGLVAAPLSTRWPHTTLSARLENINCRHLITDRQVPELLNINIYNFTDIASKTTTGRPASMQLPSEQPLTLVHTSGSSGNPKAALHSFGNHYFNALGSNSNIPLHPGDRWLVSLPLYHVGGLAILFRCWLAGAAVTIPAPEQSLQSAINELGPTHLSLVATQLQRLLKDPGMVPALQKTKAILLGGSAIPGALVQKTVDLGLPIHTSYGSTEMASQITTTKPGDGPEQLHSSGVLLPHRELRIADKGEVLVRGETLFRGYVNGSNITPAIDGDGWFHTGDTGRLDSNGYLHVTGRLDNQFISGGENIQPEEIERVLESIAGIERAVVVPAPHPEFGQRPVAFIKTNNWKPIPEADIRQILAQSLERFKLPDRFLPWPDNADDKAMKIDRGWFEGLVLK